MILAVAGQVLDFEMRCDELGGLPPALRQALKLNKNYL